VLEQTLQHFGRKHISLGRSEFLRGRRRTRSALKEELLDPGAVI